MTRCLVTGGAGFIGSHLVDALLTKGHDVRVLDNFATGDRRNLLHVRHDVEILEGELRSFERVLAATRGCEIVFHQAALPSVPRSIDDPLTSSDVNVTGTLNVLLAARECDVRRVVYASSSSVYRSSAGPKTEDMPVSPLSPYGVSKLAGEAYCLSFFRAYGLETASLRYFNVFGPRQNPVSEYAAVVPSFIAAALLGERPTIYGDGEQARDFTYIDNVVDANLCAMHVAEAAGEIFNVACGESHSVNHLLREIASILERPVLPRHLPPRIGEVRTSIADIGKARAILGYRPRVSLGDGLRHACDHFLSDDSLIPRIHEHRRWTRLAG